MLEKIIDADKMLRDEIEKRNHTLLELFYDDMVAQNLKKETLDELIFDADTYLHIYLMSGDGPYTMEQGVDKLDGYFSYFYPRKCMWSNPANTATSAESIRLFYKCMADHGMVSEEAYKGMADEIDHSIAEWQEVCRKWDAWQPSIN